MEAARPEECRTFNNRYLLVLANHNILILNKREQKIEGLEVDPNPSSFLPLFFVSHNSSNCIPRIYITIYVLATTTHFWQLGRPSSIEHRRQTVPPEDRHKTDKWTS